MDEFGGGWETRRDALLEIDGWQMSGRAAIQVEEDAWSANLDWQQRAADYVLELYGPLGQGRLRLEGGADGVTAKSGDGREVVAASPEALIYQELGWTMPVSGLRYWVRGVPAPQLPVEDLALDELGRLARLQQAGWQVQYSRYGDDEGVDMPRRMQLHNGEISVRVVIDRWAFPAETATFPYAAGG